MDRHPQNDWGAVEYDARFDSYWVETGGLRQDLFFCPWCGEKLPASQQDRWFDDLEDQGFDPFSDPVPEPYRTGAWRGAETAPAPPRSGGPIDGRYLPPPED